MMMRKTILFTLVLVASSGCVSHLSPYKMDVRQGNFVTPEMRDKLKLGMSKQQVRYVLGTPLLNDAFHGNRWDYSYSLAQHGKLVEHQAMTLYFDGENLARIDENGQSQIATAPVESPVVAAASEVVIAPVAASAVVASNVATNAAVDNETAAKASVKNWSEAWAARDAKRYLASYADDFKPANLSHEVWQNLRTQRLEKPKSIAIVLSDMKVKTQDETHATASFKQGYRSDIYHDQVRKVLQLEKRADAWLIVSEKIEK